MNFSFSLLGLMLLTYMSQDAGASFDRLRTKEKSKWVVLNRSSINIAGHTNVNHFSCGVPDYAEPDTLCFLPEGAHGQVPGIPLTGRLRLNVDQFDCRTHLMTEEFKKALKYYRYPHLVINFINLEKMPVFASRPEPIKGWVEIELAGACKMFEIDYTASRSEGCMVILTGSRTMTFHDFGLTPPHKMGGLIRVCDGLDVHFNLCLRQIE